MNKALLAAIVSVFALDRLTKHLIERHIALGDSQTVIPGLFQLTHLENPGGAFSLFAGSASPWRTPALILFSLIALIVISVILWKNREISLYSVALTLIFGGAAGNLWDRLVSGKVTDFLDFYVGVHHWYPFNVADSAIVIGALLLLMEILGIGRGKVPVRT